jgi:hypothetical protein
MLALLAAFALVPATATPAAAPGQRVGAESRVSRAQAEEIISAYVVETLHFNRGAFSLDRGENWIYPDFYFYQALINNPGGSAVAGSYAVDKRTGDLWNGVVCEPFATKGVRAAQARTRAELLITPARYRKLRHQGPEC